MRPLVALCLSLAALSPAAAQATRGVDLRDPNLLGSAAFQLPRGTTVDRTPRDTGKAFDFQIKRRSLSGVVKSLDAEKKSLVLETGKGKDAKETLVDVGPAVLKAGKGHAVFADIKVGDKVSVYGETTVQGGVRAMEMTLPKERMSIPPAGKPKKEPKPEAPKSPADPKPEAPKP